MSIFRGAADAFKRSKGKPAAGAVPPPPDPPKVTATEAMVRAAQQGPERPVADLSMAKLLEERAAIGPQEALQRPRGDYRNINLDRLDTEASIEQVLDAVSFSTENAGYSPQKWAEVASEAAGLNTGDVLKKMMGRKPGELLSLPTMDRARTIMRASAARLQDRGRAIAQRGLHNISDAELLAYQRDLWEHQAIQSAVQGATRDLARGLNLLKRQPDLMDPKAFEELMQIGGGRENIFEKAKLIAKAENLNEASKVAGQASWMRKSVDALVYYRTMNLLSGPRTQVRNIVGNQLAATFSVAEKYMAAAVSQTPFIGSGEITLGHANAFAYGHFASMLDGLRLAGKALKSGESIYSRTKLDDLHMGQVTNAGAMGMDPRSATATAYDWLAAFVGYPARGIVGMDEFYKTIAFNSRARELAYDQAVVKEKLTGAARDKRIEELLSGPHDERIINSLRDEGLEGDELMRAFMGERRKEDDIFRQLYDEGLDFAYYQTFQDDMISKLTQYGQKMHRASPTLRLIVPFYKTIVNLQAYGLERSIAAPIVPQWQRDWAAGGAKRDEAVARLTIGTALTAYLVTMAIEGELVGSMPQNPNLRAVYKQAGWEPYTLYGVGLQGFEPYSTIASIIGDVADVIRYSENDQDIDDAVMIVSVAFAEALKNRSFMTGVSDLLDTLEQAKSGADFASNYTGRLAGSFIPSSQLQITIRNTLDPTLRDTYDDSMLKEVGNTIRNSIPLPILNQDLPPVLDFWGEPRGPRDWFGTNERVGWMSPFYGVDYSGDEATWQLAENAVTPARISRNFSVSMGAGPVSVDLRSIVVAGEDGKKMSPGWLYHDLSQFIGKARREAAEAVMKTDEYQNLPVGAPGVENLMLTRGDVLSAAIADGTAKGRAQFMEKYERQIVIAAQEEFLKGGTTPPVPNVLRRQRDRQSGINF